MQWKMIDKKYPSQRRYFWGFGCFLSFFVTNLLAIFTAGKRVRWTRGNVRGSYHNLLYPITLTLKIQPNLSYPTQHRTLLENITDDAIATNFRPFPSIWHNLTIFKNTDFN